jgi:uracil-DNA glycosylase
MVEDLLGEAFIGPSGKLTDVMIDEAGLDPTKCFLTNAVLCHPTDTPRGANREPKADEVLACMPNVLEIIRSANPKCVVFVGKVAQRYYQKHFDIPAVRILHPAALLRGGGRSSPQYISAIRALKKIAVYGRDDGSSPKKGFPKKATSQ